MFPSETTHGLYICCNITAVVSVCTRYIVPRRIPHLQIAAFPVGTPNPLCSRVSSRQHKRLLFQMQRRRSTSRSGIPRQITDQHTPSTPARLHHIITKNHGPIPEAVAACLKCKTATNKLDASATSFWLSPCALMVALASCSTNSRRTRAPQATCRRTWEEGSCQRRGEYCLR